MTRAECLAHEWAITLGPPYTHEGAAWVAPAQLKDGTTAVFKLGFPHFEAEQEAEGLRFWDGDPFVRLLRTEDAGTAMLLECCRPGTALRDRPEPEQDVVIAGLLKRLWRVSPPQHFRPLAALMDYWAHETIADSDRWVDTGLVCEGLRLFEELPRTATREVLLATDLHAGNVLRAEREPWLAIDPKPFRGDPAYDATQHLFNCTERLTHDPSGLIRRFADLLEVDEERVRLWAFARAAAEPRDDWSDDHFLNAFIF